MTKEALKRLIGDNIRRERIARNMTVDELAELLELTPGFVGLIERGRRGATVHNLYKLSEIFDVDIDRFTTSYVKPQLSVNEKNPAKTKRTKITSLLYQLEDSELEYVIMMIKNMKILKNNKTYETVSSAAAGYDDHENDALDNIEYDDTLPEELKKNTNDKKHSAATRKNKKTED